MNTTNFKLNTNTANGNFSIPANRPTFLRILHNLPSFTLFHTSRQNENNIAAPRALRVLVENQCPMKGPRDSKHPSHRSLSSLKIISRRTNSIRTVPTKPPTLTSATPALALCTGWYLHFDTRGPRPRPTNAAARRRFLTPAEGAAL